MNEVASPASPETPPTMYKEEKGESNLTNFSILSVKIHDIPISNGRPDGMPNNRCGASLQRKNQTHALVTGGALSADQKDLLTTVTEGKLIHGDLGLIHFFADLESGELTGIIDFGECKAGGPVWDFVDFR